MLSAYNSIITVMSNLVSQMTPLVTIDSNNADGSNWTLTMCDTFWLNVGSVVTIGGVDFTVESYVKNVSITVSGAAQPIGATFLLDAPEFTHGSHRKVEGERKGPIDLSKPFVYLPVPEVTESNEVNDDVAYTAKIRPLFLMEYDKNKDEIDLQQAEIIDPCNEMADFFVWLIEDQQENFERPEGITRKEWMNFGDPTTWGNDKVIFDQPLSGVEIRMDLEVSYDAPCLCDSATPVICAPVTETWNGSDITSIASGSNKVIKTVDASDGVTPVGTKIVDTTGELTVEIAVGGLPAGNRLNGATLIDILGGTTKNFTITYADLSPVVVTEVSDSATAFAGTVPNSVSGIAYLRNGWTTRNRSNFTHDLGWYLANETVFDYNVNGISVILDPNDSTKLLTNNAFGNLNRVTNSNGLTATYDGSNGEITDYAIDHLTGYGWYLKNAVTTNINFVDSAITLRAATLATFSDWRMITMSDVHNIINGNSTPDTIFSSIELWTKDLSWVMNSTAATTGYFWRVNQHIGASIWMNTRTITSASTSIMTIGVRNHY